MHFLSGASRQKSIQNSVHTNILSSNVSQFLLCSPKALQLIKDAKLPLTSLTDHPLVFLTATNGFLLAGCCF